MATFLQGRRAGLPSESTSSRSARGTRHGTQAGPGPGGSLRDEHIVSPPWTLVALPVRDRHVDRSGRCGQSKGTLVLSLTCQYKMLTRSPEHIQSQA
jgi:hypothetical protein